MGVVWACPRASLGLNVTGAVRIIVTGIVTAVVVIAIIITIIIVVIVVVVIIIHSARIHAETWWGPRRIAFGVLTPHEPLDCRRVPPSVAHLAGDH